MKTRNLLFFIFIASSATIFSQTAELTYTFSSESDIRNGPQEIIVTITGDTLRSEVGSVEADAADFLAGMTGGSAAWDALIATLDASNILLEESDSVARISIPATGEYFIGADDTITFTVPSVSLLSGGAAITVSPDIIIGNEDPVISITSESYAEAAIRSGSIDFVITLAGDIWESSLSSDFGDRIVSGGDWDSQITPNLTVSRTDDNTITVTIPATPGFDIISTETVEVGVLSDDLQYTGSGTFQATEVKTISPEPVTVSGSATFDGEGEEDIRTNSYQITLILQEDSWAADIGTNHNTNRDLIQGLSFSASQDPGEMVNAILAGDFGDANTSVSGNTVTITVPSIPGFNITADVDVSLTVPAAALINSSSNVSTGNFASISRIEPSMVIETTVPASPINSSDLNGAILNIKLYEETWDNSTFNRNNFSFNWDPPDAAAISIASNGDISYVADDEINITLSFSGTLSENKSFSMTVDAAELSGSSQLTTSSGVAVIAIIEPVITGVSIPNIGMGIGETVTATLEVEDDRGQLFALLGGTIAGRAVYDLNRSNETTYTLKFDIGAEHTNPQYAAGDAIPYTNLQLQNGTLTGVQYSGSISQDADPIDTERPELSLVSLNNGNYRVGETLVITMQSSEADLTFDQGLSSINTVPLTEAGVSVHNAGSGVYQIAYMIEEGQPDVLSPDPMPINLVLTDGVGNNSNPVTSYSGTNPVIDANSPVITAVDETTTGTVIPGGNVVYSITAGEAGLMPGSGTMVNDVGLNTGRITFAHIGGNNYELSYEVGPDDREAASGNLNVTVVLKDTAGNEATFAGVVTNKDVAVVTSTPIADLFGGGAICAGDSAQLYVTVSGGTAPYKVTIYEDGVEYAVYNDVDSELTVTVSPSGDKTYLLHSVEDAMGLIGFYAKSVEVTVNLLPTPQFSPTTRKVYSSEGGGSSQLTASPTGGIFSGPGVVPSEDRFYPAIAGVTDTIDHAIVYTYQDNITQCYGTDTVYFTVLPTSGGLVVNYPDAARDGIICYDDPMFEVTGNNVDGLIGSFMLYLVDRTFEIPLPEAIVDPDPNDNRAFIDPSRLGDRSSVYKVTYEYVWKSETVILEEQLAFDYISDISFSKAIPGEVCRDAESVALEAAPNTGGSFVFSGPGVYGNEVLGFTFEPSLGDIGKNTLNYSYTSNAGCRRSDQLEIINFDVPEVNFIPQDVCIPPVDAQTGEGGGPISFNNETTKPELISSWIWEFGDINSGLENYDTIMGDGTARSVIHDFTAPGNRNVTLEVITYDGCMASRSKNIEFADKPSADFRVVSDCWIPGEAVEFRNYSSSQKPWESFTWTINNEANTWDTTIVTVHKDSLAKVFFNNSNDIFEIQLRVKNIAGIDLYCEDIKQDYDFVLKPTQRFETVDSRFMTFDDGAENWTVDSATNYSSWKWGVPDFAGYDPPPGNHSWFTSSSDMVLPENSWIQSECYDLRNLERPMVRMDVMKSFDRNRDGAVIQYTLDNGATWNTLGNIGEGINWYNSFEIANRPGGGKDGTGSSIGWSGAEIFNPDTGWVTVAHDLDLLTDERLVIFGIFYATDGASVIDNQGFAIDNIYIGERTKRGLIEHFTNLDDPASLVADNSINSFVTDNELDVTSLQYHMPYPVENPINELNPGPPSARSFYYGITQVPFALLDGGIGDEFLYDFAPSSPAINQLKRLTLERPEFDLDLRYQMHSGSLSATVDITAIDQIDSADVVLHVAVVEKALTSYGSNEYKNVVLDMLPSPAGTVLPLEWDTNVTVSRNFSWNYDHIENYDELMLVAFLQDRTTRKVLQVVQRATPLYPLNIQNYKDGRLKVYPNPVHSILYLEREEGASDYAVVEISDMTGRILVQKKKEPGAHRIGIDTGELSSGTYILQLKENGFVKGRASFMKLD